MHVEMTDEARAVEQRFYDDRNSKAYDRLWDVIDAILADPEAALHAPRAHHVSSFNLWGSKIPGTDWTVFWRIADDALQLVYIFEDRVN